MIKLSGFVPSIAMFPPEFCTWYSRAFRRLVYSSQFVHANFCKRGEARLGGCSFAVNVFPGSSFVYLAFVVHPWLFWLFLCAPLSPLR